MIDGNVSPASVYAADAGASPEAEIAPVAQAATPPVAAASGTIYTVDLGESDQRQMTTTQLVEAYNNASVTPDTYVWADGFADWTPLGQVEEVVAALHAAAAANAAGAPPEAASALGASTQIDEKPWDSGPSVPKAPAGVGFASPATAGADLFGGVSDAGNESDGAAMGTASNPFSGANTGARNESSVLFSLSALTSGTGSSRPSVPAPAMPSSASHNNNDDSGLIDLKALTATAQAMAPTAQRPAPMMAAAVSPFAGASPLGGPSPLSTPNYGSALGSMPPPKNNTGLYIGASIVIAAIAVAAIVTFGGGEEQPVAPPVPAAPPLAAAPAPALAPAPAPAADATSDAKPPATGTEGDSSAPTTTKKKSYSKPAASSPAPSASPSPAAAAPKPKAKGGGGKCGCKADDLMCLMNCAK